MSEIFLMGLPLADLYSAYTYWDNLYLLLQHNQAYGDIQAPTPSRPNM